MLCVCLRALDEPCQNFCFVDLQYSKSFNEVTNKYNLYYINEYIVPANKRNI